MRPDTTGRFEQIEADGFYGDLCLGNMTMYRACVRWVRGGKLLFVGLEGYGAWSFERDSMAAHIYVIEKLGGLNTQDSCNLADFINDQMVGLPDDMKEIRQGTYRYPDLCRPEP